MRTLLQAAGQKIVASHLTKFDAKKKCQARSSSSLSHNSSPQIHSSRTYKSTMELKINQAPGFSDLFHLSAEKLQQLDAVLKAVLTLPIALPIAQRIRER